MSKFQTLIDRQDGFNDVSAWMTPNGELVISLSHSSTSDEETLVRVRSEDDVILTDEVLARNAEAWEDDNEQLGRLNHGKNWISDTDENEAKLRNINHEEAKG